MNSMNDAVSPPPPPPEPPSGLPSELSPHSELPCGLTPPELPEPPTPPAFPPVLPELPPAPPESPVPAFIPSPAGESQFVTAAGIPRSWKYLGLGCALVVVAGCVVGALGVGWGVGKVGSVISQVKANPEKFTAEMMVKADPTLELITSNEAAGEITFRNTQSGEIVTLSYAEAAQGSSLLSGVGSQADTTALTAAASTAAAALPDWFPLMDGLTLSPAVIRSSTAAHDSIRLSGTTTATTEEVVTFFNDELDARGFTVSRQSQRADGSTMELVEASEASMGRHVTITVSRPEATAPAMIILTIEEPPASR